MNAEEKIAFGKINQMRNDTLTSNKIRIGFMAIRNLQEKTINNILEERKNGNFRSLDDFLLRTDINLADAMALVNAGCFMDLCTKLNPNKRIICQN